MLPLRPKPLEDELLSSWLVRLAFAHHMKLQSFCHEIWPNRSIWNRDPDRSADDRLLASLSNLTGVTFADVGRTTLRDYEGVLFPRHIRNGNTRWLMPLGIYHRVRKRTGLQFCPMCLRDSPVPYFRRTWRLSLFVACTWHQVILVDRCPGCGHPIHLHRAEMGKRNAYQFDNTRCCQCTHSLIDVPARAASARVLALQLQHEDLLSGRVRFHTETLAYFNVLAHLLKLLASTRVRFQAFQRVVAELTNTRQAPIDALRQQQLSLHFDSLPVEARVELLSAGFELMHRWPTLMCEAYGKAGLRESDVMRDFVDPPEWYKDFLVSGSVKRNAAHA